MISDKIVDLTSKWYRYIGPMHHKDKDCHWNIDVSYSYGQPPVYAAYIHGYLFSDQREDRDNFKQAEMDLLLMVREAVQTEWEEVSARKERGEDFDEDYHRFVEIFEKEDYGAV
jgi:hypothetical protein